ncbi:hypothetical protein KKC1_12500 [Calderihabitans maritimus]|uniref:Uncharacterized protein n=1 Tax=Calderihabitans maritimus TaxID=1246530 RepID=A0A1Z5HRZ0_9FIRM|nr:hypothetical protein KKC1_12500 [Calderihabitans maritimus]
MSLFKKTKSVLIKIEYDRFYAPKILPALRGIVSPFINLP